jgi:hypothetical protein
MFNVSDPESIGSGNPDPDSKYPDAGRPKVVHRKKKRNFMVLRDVCSLWKAGDLSWQNFKLV